MPCSYPLQMERARELTGEVATAELPARAGSRNTRVLVVEDEHDIAALIKHALERSGDVQDQLTLLQDASKAVQAAAREGKCWEPAEKELQLEKYKDWPGYENGRPLVVRRYCGLWGRGT